MIDVSINQKTGGIGGYNVVFTITEWFDTEEEIVIVMKRINRALAKIDIDEKIDFSKYKEKVDIISKELHRISNDPKVIEKGEELQRTLGHLTPEDLLRRFDI